MGRGGWRAGARFKRCIGTNTKVEAGICQEEPGRLLHGLLRLCNGALLLSQGPRDKAATLWGRILHLLKTKNTFLFVVKLNLWLCAVIFKRKSDVNKGQKKGLSGGFGLYM